MRVAQQKRVLEKEKSVLEQEIRTRKLLGISQH